MGALVGEQREPMRQCHLPQRALRRLGAAFQVVEGLLVRSHQTGARAALDGHVADRHPAFHRQVADRLAAIFDDMTGAAGCAGRADYRQRDVLGGHTRRQGAGDLDLHVLRLLLDQRLCRQHMLDFRCADAMSQRAESAVGGGVAVAADDGHAGLGQALLRPDDMDDTLAHIVDVKEFDAEVMGVLAQGFNLDAALLVLDALVAVQRGGDVVIGYRQRRAGRADRAPGHAQALEGLRAGHLVDQMAVDIQEAGAVLGGVGHMAVPDLVVEGFWRAHCKFS
jgi:hypothetical protein